MRLTISGAVQGVGFRPFVYRLAQDLDLAGWVGNDPGGVVMEIEGAPGPLRSFTRRLRRELPPVSRIESITRRRLPVRHSRSFRIRASAVEGRPQAEILPDLATCPECLDEVRQAGNRRHGYPFTNCTHCGPRFTIVRELPYDRPRTTMADFPLCAACATEYHDPGDRRFHAQPNACPRCGPRLTLRDAAGVPGPTGRRALAQAATALRAGLVLAVKGLGGFHLVCSARLAAPLRRLRQVKGRRDKPFALMAADVEQVRTLCHVERAAARLLTGPRAPIVLMPRRHHAPVHELVAPRSRRLGVMLPYTPLHHLLLAAVGEPLVATSGNLKDEPICIDEEEACARLSGLAQMFLVHNRPIARQADDSVVQVAAGRPRLLRRARGYAPAPVPAGQASPCLLAVGGHQKVTLALGTGDQVMVSQHLGDMETPEALAALQRTADDLTRLYRADPVAIVRDAHPDYATTAWAEEEAARRGVPCIPVQHHHAHLASCLMENGHGGEALGVTWDGTGHGGDGTVWGGEFLEGSARGCSRVAHLHPFSLPGGAVAVRQPRRVALALLWELEGPMALGRTELRPVASFRPPALRVLGGMLETGLNAPRCTSAGRLFDGVAALLGLRQEVHDEGTAAMELEQLADPDHRDAYPLPLQHLDGVSILDWRVLLRALLEDMRRGTAPARMAARFHNGLVAAMVAVAAWRGREWVALTGGCFQNVLLLERATESLEKAGHRVLLHSRVPSNDGGLSLGQIAVAAARLRAARGIAPQVAAAAERRI